MTRSAADLVEQYDVDPAAIEAFLVRYGDLEFESCADELTTRAKLVREFFESDDGKPIRAGPDHYYQFEQSEWAERPSAPGTETEFEEVLDTLVRAGVVARTDETRPRYSASYYEVLSELGKQFTASEIDDICETTGMPTEQVYYYLFTQPTMDIDLTA